jgi:hypothetical protein
VKPLMRRRSAAMRPHVLFMIGLALAMFCMSTAEAGRRGRKAKKARSRAEVQAPVGAQTTPAPGVASADDSAGDRARLAGGADPTPERRSGASKPREKVFDFSALELGGSERMPQLLYFLDRAEEELERASLERRSFVPEMMRSLDEENL